MNHREYIRTLSGCRFYRERQQDPKPAKPSPEERKEKQGVDRETRKRLRNRIFKRYCVLTGGLLTGSLLLFASPLWLVHPPYAKAFLLSLPPMVLTALSWMAGAWWAWDRDRNLFLVATMGVTPLRMVLVLAWAWLVVSIPDVPVNAFLLALMLHWTLFTVPEIAMLLEFSKG